jgi:hypothetical protein
MSSTPTAVSSPSAPALEETLQRLHVYTPETLDSLCIREGQKPSVVDGLIPAGSIGLVAGDSGLGKSPLFYQLALCVAAGIPWLGMRTVQAAVLYLDLENGWSGSRALRDSVLRHLGLQGCPPGFLCAQDIRDLRTLTAAIEAAKPALVVIDSLRSFDFKVEENNRQAGEFLQALRKLCQQYGVSFLLIHHIKKQEKKTFLQGGASLETDPVVQWMALACGARAPVNQSDVRIGVDRSSKPNACLIIRGHVRITGEVGPFYLERAFDDDEQPIGYKRLSGVELLDNKDQQSAFDKLPLAFSFKEAKASYGRHDQATADFLSKCLRFGILRKPTKGRYEKVPRATPE